MQGNNNDRSQHDVAGTSRDFQSTTLRAVRVVASRWKLLITLLLLGGFLGLGVSRLIDNYYTSTATLMLNDLAARNAESMMRSPVVLDSVIAAFPDLKGRSPEDRRMRLNRLIGMTTTYGDVRRTATIFLFNVQDTRPERAQQIASMLLAKWLELTVPRPEAKLRIEQQIKSREERVKEIETLHDKLASESPSLAIPNSLLGEYATPLNKLKSEQKSAENELWQLKQELRGSTRDAVIGPPTLPVEPTWPRPSIAAAFGAFTLGLLALLYIAGVEVRKSIKA